MKKLGFLIAGIVLLFVTFLFIYLSPKNYEKEYDIDGFAVIEKYDKKKESYIFSVAIDKLNFKFLSNQKYTTNRKLITSITTKKSESGICIQPYIQKEVKDPLCYENDTYIDYRLASKDLWESERKITTLNDEYNNIKINYLDSDTYLLWNYRGFSLINNERKEDIKIFETDVYNLELAVVINKYLVVADYDQKYNFNKMFIVNLEKLSIEEWELDAEISFDSYILGTEDKSIYLVDRKNEIEYELVPHKKRMRKVGTKNKSGRILKNGTWEDISLTQLVNKSHTFSNVHDYEYTLEDNTLYLNYEGDFTKIKVSNAHIGSIVTAVEDRVYYLVKDKLFMYSLSLGEIQIFEYFEWNFNTENMIFINK